MLQRIALRTGILLVVFSLSGSGAALAASVCTDQVPTLTGDTSAVSTSGNYSSSYRGWKAFDASSSSMWISKTWQTPAWIAYNFGTGKIVHRYTITNTNGSLTSRAPKDFTLQGWNGSTWVTVDTRTGQTGWVSGVPRTYEVQAPGSYTKYRLHVTDDNDVRSGVVIISIGDLKFEYCQVSVNLECERIFVDGHRCIATPLYGAGSNTFNWTYVGDGNMYPNLNTAIVVINYCEASPLFNNISVVVTDGANDTAMDSVHGLSCDDGEGCGGLICPASASN